MHSLKTEIRGKKPTTVGFLPQVVVNSLRMLLEGYKYLNPQNRREGGYERISPKQGPLPDVSTLFILAVHLQV